MTLPLPCPTDDFFAQFGAEQESDSEHRRHPRYDCNKSVEVLIHPVEAGRRPARCFLLTKDISLCGLSLIHAIELQPGQLLEITFDDMPTKHAKVVWCRRLPNRHYAVGCKFIPATDDRDV